MYINITFSNRALQYLSYFVKLNYTMTHIVNHYITKTAVNTLIKVAITNHCDYGAPIIKQLGTVFLIYKLYVILCLYFYV